MFGSMFSNMPNVVKNLVIINALFFLATVVMESKGIYLGRELGLYYVGSPEFQPYQLATHFFMHGGMFHILFNMIALVVFGSQLERMWGPKRFLIFYFVTALGAAALHMFVQGLEIYNAVGTAFPDVGSLDVKTIMGDTYWDLENPAYNVIADQLNTPTVGASGAVYGLIAAFAMLFPNTQLMLLFPPIPIKAKYLALGLAALAVYQGYKDADGDSVAHFAHLGGMIIGFIMVKIWQKNTTTFY